MTETTTEDLTTPDLLGGQDKSRAAGEEQEKVVQQGQEDMMQEDRIESHKKLEVSKTKAKMQSVLCLVRHQIRAQPAPETCKSGMLQLVERVTRHLDQTKAEEQDNVEVFAFDKEITETQQDAEEKQDSQEDECVALLHEVLSSIEMLRKEVHEEITLLKQESQSHTEKVLQGLETRLTTSVRIDVKEKTNPSHSVTLPPLPGVARKPPLRRTMTTVPLKSSAPLVFRSRCMSEPVVSQAGTMSNGIIRALPKGAEVKKGQLLPSLPATQTSKAKLRSKPVQLNQHPNQSSSQRKKGCDQWWGTETKWM